MEFGGSDSRLATTKFFPAVERLSTLSCLTATGGGIVRSGRERSNGSQPLKGKLPAIRLHQRNKLLSASH